MEMQNFESKIGRVFGFGLGLVYLTVTLMLLGCNQKMKPDSGAKEVEEKTEDGEPTVALIIPSKLKPTATKEDLCRIIGSTRILDLRDSTDRDLGIFTILSDGTEQKTIPFPDSIVFQTPAWLSPDGKKIYYAKKRDDSEDDMKIEQDAVECNVDGTGCRNLIPNFYKQAWRSSKGKISLGDSDTQIFFKSQYLASKINQYFLDDLVSVRKVNIKTGQEFSMPIWSRYMLPISSCCAYVNYSPNPEADLIQLALIDIEKRKIVKIIQNLDSNTIQRSTVNSDGDKILTGNYISEQQYGLTLYDNNFNPKKFIALPKIHQDWSIDPSGNWFVFTDKVGIWRMKILEVFDGSKSHDSIWVSNHSQLIYPYPIQNGSVNNVMELKMVESK